MKKIQEQTCAMKIRVSHYHGNEEKRGFLEERTLDCKKQAIVGYRKIVLVEGDDGPVMLPE